METETCLKFICKCGTIWLSPNDLLYHIKREHNVAPTKWEDRLPKRAERKK